MKMHLPVTADLSQSSLEMAMMLLPLARTYNVVVHPTGLQSAKRLLKEIADSTKDNIFAPWINLSESTYLAPGCWQLRTSNMWVESGIPVTLGGEKKT